MTIDLEDVLASHGPDDPARFIAIADHFLTADDPHAAAAALDRAYGLAPDDADLENHRAAILDQLAVQEHGLVWRYVPAGTFLMGSETGDPDERPVHPRRLPAFWITDAPVTWHDYCVLLGWSEPPQGWPPEGTELERDERFEIAQAHKIRSRYCGTPLMDSQEWQAQIERSFTGEGPPPRIPVPGRFGRAPMVAVSVREAERLTARLSTAAVRYALPTEAQWEKAARGGLVGRRYAWGDAPPTRERCDFDRMGDYRLIDPRELPPNGYGLFGMCGGVSEWTADVYDALAYHRARAGDLSAPTPPEDDALGVLRGGSWTDCADAVTVSYRTAYGTERAASPTIGFRLVRMTR
jgi:formylglycine-generating enzyme required for sulfatase activity